MKKVLFLVLFALSLVGCGDDPELLYGTFELRAMESRIDRDVYIKRANDGMTVKKFHFPKRGGWEIITLPVGKYYLEYMCQDGDVMTDYFMIHYTETTYEYVMP